MFNDCSFNKNIILLFSKFFFENKKMFTLSIFKVMFIFVFIIFPLEKVNAQGTNCGASVLLTVNAAPITGLANDTTVNDPTATSCITGTIVQDGWYSFVASGTTANVTVISNNRQLVLYAYSGTCVALTQISCANANTTAGGQTEVMNLTGLTNGITYYVRVGNSGSGPSITINAISVTTTTPPVNYLCSTATTLPCATTNLAGTTVNTTNVVHNTACSMSNYGVWYTFTGDGNQTTIASTATGGFDHEMSISSGSCGTFANLACQDSGLSNGTETFTFTTVNGVNYYVYIAHYSTSGTTTGTFTISRTCTAPPVPPINDECINAIPLTVTSACSYATYSNVNGTASSGIPAPGCSSYSGGDVWFSAVVPVTGILTVDTQTGVILDGGMAFYTGTCGSLVLLSCDDDSSLNGAMPYISQTTGITPGQTIYIRFWEYGNDNNGTFGICATSPTCVAPTLSATTNITTTTATINWTAPAIIPSGGYQYIVSTSSITPTIPGTATVLTTINLTGLLSDTTYYVFVRSNCGSGDFSPWTAYQVFTTGFCPSTSTSSTYYINNFSTTGGTANITNNSSGYSVAGFGNFTAQSVSQINFGSVSFSAAFYDGFYSYGFNIWVDWNDDFDFNDAGELVYASGSYITSATGSFSVPGSASVGNHRMRIRANYFSTNPSACGSISSGETEDYTFTVLAPLPCSGNPSAVIVNITSQTTATINWTAAVPAPAIGYQYYLSLSNATPSAAAIPSGSVGAGITTVSLTGLLAGTSYSVWVRSNCGGALGQGVWIGPINFHQPNCSIGNGTGTTTLACPAIVSGGLGLSGANPAPINSCGASSCTDLEATYLPIGQTTSYNVSSIAYSPPYQFNCLKNPLSVNVDDVWSPVVNLPFNFCFYGNNYNQCLIGSNGVITFDQTNNLPGGYSTYSFANNIPNPSLFKNTIFGVYHDIDPSISGEVGWELITLNTGCRALVASWSKIPMFSSTCNSSLYTGMIVLYENTNVIEVYAQEKNVCSTWNGGNAVIGIQNADGTLATVAPGRNSLDTDWTVSNEAWRFTPSGASISSIKWYEGAGTSGPVVGTTDGIGVCPTFTTIYTAEVTYALCGGNTFKEVGQTTVTVIDNKVWNGSVSTDWNVANNWTPSGIPNASDCVVIPVTASTRYPIISTGSGGLAKTLSVLNGASLLINSSNSVTVTNWVIVQPSGTFQIENNSSLIQVNNTTNTGNIIYKRDASIRKLDYVYWSSPVANFNVSSIASPLVSGPIFSWNPTVANLNGGQGNWINAIGSTMAIGKGYIVRGPSSFSPTVNTTLNGIFTGVPNNGTITIPISRGSDTNTVFHAGVNGTQITNYSDNMNLLGNPYPSAIRGSQFLFNNNTKIEGNIKLWTHGTLPAIISSPFYGTFLYNYSVGDYLTYNFTGSSCCPAAGSDLFIGAGQGFFVQMKDGPTATDVVTFNNNLRSAAYSNSTFYRPTNQFTSNNNSLVDIERNRIWLDIIDANNQSDRTLIGYIEGATMERDSYFDAISAISSSLSIYSLIDSNKYLIQGRVLPFDQNDIVPLGVTIPTDGTYKIGINVIDGLFENTAQNIYLEDRLFGIIVDLRHEPYSFHSTIGNYTNRFYLRYTNPFLGVNPIEVQNTSVYIHNEILFAKASQNIINIQVYDVTGKLIKTFLNNEKSKNFSDNFNYAKGVYLAKIKLENGTVFNKKLIN